MMNVQWGQLCVLRFATSHWGVTPVVVTLDTLSTAMDTRVMVCIANEMSLQVFLRLFILQTTMSVVLILPTAANTDATIFLGPTLVSVILDTGSTLMGGCVQVRLCIPL